MPTTAPQSPAEELFLEQAQAYFRELKAAADNAPYGQVLNQADLFAFQHGRELIRKGLEGLMQDQIKENEKKKKRPTARHAKRKNGTAAIKRKHS